MTADQGIKPGPRDGMQPRAVIFHTENSPVYLDPRIGFKETSFDDARYLYVPFEQMKRLNFNLIEQIRNSGQQFDRIIALSRGGLTMARDLSDGLEIDPVTPIRFKRYQGVNQAGKPVLEEGLPRGVGKKIRGARLILDDEVIDEGITAEAAIKYLQRFHPASITVVSLAYKPHSRLRPDFYALETSDWIVFDHENNEFIKGELNKWMGDGLSLEEARRRFLEIGISAWEVDFHIQNYLKQSSAQG